jgi:enoyl-CoA hydratase
MSDSEPSPPTLTIERQRATITLERPSKRNRIEPADITEILGHCVTIAANPEIRVVVLRSRGPSWCSGYHLGALAEGERAEHSFGDLCDAIEAITVPTIAALHGNVHGGGTDLAVSCDFRIGADHIVLAMPAARIGLQYYASGLRRFVDRIGTDATKRLFLTAETVQATELLRIGYCTELVPESGLEARVDALANAISALAPDAVRATKAAIDQLGTGRADLAAIEASHARSTRSPEHREAMAAMKEQRAPRFG